MAINITDLFDKIGKLLNIVTVANTHMGTTIVSDFDEMMDNYEASSDRDLIQNALDYQNSYQTGSDALAGNMSSIMEDTIIEIVNDDDAQPDRTLDQALVELKEQMVSQAETLVASNVSYSSTAAGINNGNGTLVTSVKHPRGWINENLFDEDIIITVTSDSVSDGTYAGNESFTAEGEYELVSPLNFDYPDQGSAGNITFSAICASGADNSYGNTLTNSDFVSYNPANDPTFWDLNTGAAGTDFLMSTGTVLIGTACLELVGDGATLHDFSQNFGDAADGTSGDLAPLSQYSCALWFIADDIPATGVLRVSLDEDDTISQDYSGTQNYFDIDLTGAATGAWTVATGVFRTPRVKPIDSWVMSLACVTAIETGKSIYIDNLGVGAMAQIYDNGPWMSVHSSSTRWIREDFLTLTPTNDHEGTVYYLMDQALDLRGLDRNLPTAATGVATITNSIIS